MFKTSSRRVLIPGPARWVSATERHSEPQCRTPEYVLKVQY